MKPGPSAIPYRNLWRRLFSQTRAPVVRPTRNAGGIRCLVSVRTTKRYVYQTQRGHIRVGQRASAGTDTDADVSWHVRRVATQKTYFCDEHTVEHAFTHTHFVGIAVVADAAPSMTRTTTDKVEPAFLLMLLAFAEHHHHASFTHTRTRTRVLVGFACCASRRKGA